MPAARELEAALSRLQPVSAVGIDEAIAGHRPGVAYRDGLMFRAGEAAGEQTGRTAGRRQLRAWRGAAAVLAAATFAFSARTVTRPVNPAVVVYIHDSAPPTQAGTTGPENRQRNEPSVERPSGQIARGADDAAPASPWMNVRGDYLSTRAAVLRWGVAALPRVDDSAAETSTPTPLDGIKKQFWHKSDGGRL
jgi:hypothetical protein